NTQSAGSLVTNLCWLFGSLALTITDVIMLLRESPSGLALTGILVTGWGAKTTAGVVDANNKRKADPKYKEVVEAAERGKSAGAAAKINGQPPVTAERPALMVNADRATVTQAVGD